MERTIKLWQTIDISIGNQRRVKRKIIANGSVSAKNDKLKTMLSYKTNQFYQPGQLKKCVLFFYNAISCRNILRLPLTYKKTQLNDLFMKKLEFSL